MIQIGNPPFLECSSKGFKPFSAFYAYIPSKKNTIENLYQAHKIFENGLTNLSWKEAKGKIPINYEDCCIYYANLWDEYIDNHPEYVNILEETSGFQDMFGQKGHVCQAIELWRIKNKLKLIKFFGG